ncbi:hypothetical protein GOP47_0018346 [Adiantum capillus-veneris]|uniref:Uncharacterized protein n=1 Tax=Adiantum capillus-veneris TaxID=13818 RepID=A0A9D4UI34_ADICA|nr:hypothetical protein GOP47_0018346 [Adiantum capillus-veneris]
MPSSPLAIAVGRAPLAISLSPRMIPAPLSPVVASYTAMLYASTSWAKCFSNYTLDIYLTYAEALQVYLCLFSGTRERKMGLWSLNAGCCEQGTLSESRCKGEQSNRRG